MAEDGQEDMTPEQIARLQKENCIFCKLVTGDIPSKKIYEDNDFVGLLDINPATDGHVLLITKQHFQILPQIPQDIVGNLGIACAKVSGKIIKSFKCEGTSIFIANGAVAGQRAPHFMVHIIPRKDADNISLNPKLADIDERLFNTVKDRLLASMKVPPRSAAGEVQKTHTPVKNTSVENSEEEPADIAEESETELEEEHRLKKERDSRRKKEQETSRMMPEKKSEKDEKGKESAGKDSKQNSKVDFDKLSRLLDK